MPDAEYILRIILRARDEMAGALAKARGELALLTNQSQQWRSELKRLNGELDNFFSRLDRFSKRATTNIRDEIQAHRQATSSSGTMAAAVGRLGDEEEKMGRKVRVASSDIRKGASDLRGHGREARSARNSVEELGQSMLNSSRNMKTWGDNIGATDNKLRGLIVAAALIFIQQLDTAVVGLGGGLVELASSAAMAGGALGGILAAGAAQALPVVAELAATMHRVSMVWNVVQQQQKVNEQQAFRNTQATKQQAGASNTLANSQNGLKNAHEGVVAAEDALSKARKQAFRDIQDLNAAAKQSLIQEEQASLAQEDARKALSDALAAGDIDAARRARIQVEEADANAQKAKIDRQRARDDANLANRQGVRGAPGVVAAQRQLEQANRGVAQAQRALDNARKSADAANQDMFAAKSNLQYLMAQLSPAEKQLYQALTRIQATYKKAFRPITDTIIGSFTYAVNRGEQILKSPQLIGAADALAMTLNKRIRGFVDSFTDPRTLSQFLQFTLEASHNLAPLSQIAKDFGHMFLDIAQDALPAFGKFIRHLDRWVGGWRKWMEDNPAKVTDFFNKGETQLEAWLRLAGAVIRLFSMITSAGGAEGGLHLIESLTNSLNRATRWVDLHREKVKGFFAEVNTVLSILGNFVMVLGTAMIELFNPERLQHFADFFNKVIIPAFQGAAWVLGLIADAVMQLANIPGFSNLLALMLTMTLTAKALRGPWDLLLGGVGKTIFSVGKFIEAMKLARVATINFFKADEGVNLVSRWKKSKLAVDEYKIAQKEAAVQAKLTTTAIEEEQIVASKPMVPPTFRGKTALNKYEQTLQNLPPQMRNTPQGKSYAYGQAQQAGKTELSAAEKAAAENMAKTEAGVVAGDVAAGAEGTIMSGIAGTVGGLALGGIGLAAGLGVINGITDAFSDKAKQLSFGGKVQEFLHGATFGIIPSAADEQAHLYVKSLAAAVKGELAKPEVRKDFFPQPTPVRGPGAGNTAFANVQQTRIAGERQKSGDPADIVDPLHQLSGHQREIVRSLSTYRETFDQLRSMGVTTFQSLIDQLSAFEKKNPEAAASVDRLLTHIERFQKRVNDITKGHALVFDLANALQLDPDKAQTITDNFIKQLKHLSPRARAEAVNAAKGVVSGLASQGKLPQDVANKINDDVSHAFAQMRRRSRTQSGKAAEETTQNLQVMLNSVGLMNAGFVANINDLLNKLGAKKSTIKWASLGVHMLPGGFQQFIQAGAGILDDSKAGGGFISKPGHRGKDTVVTALGKGEAVLNWAHQRMVEPAMRAYWGMGLGDMFRMRNAYHGGGPGDSIGFAGGGFVNSVGARIDTPDERAIARALARLGKAMGITFSPVGPRSAHRTASENAAVGGAGNSRHLFGQAMDVAPDLVKNIANSVLNKFGLNRPIPGNWVDASGNVHDERNHLMLLGGGGGGGGASTDAAVAAAIDTRLKKMPHMPGDGAIAVIANRMIDRVNKAAQAYVDRHAGDGGDTGGGGNPAANRRLGKALMLKMWGEDQWPFLNKLWTRESGWDETIKNPTSSAIGIPQDITGNTHGGARGQIVWGLKYIKDRYGSPAGAWAHEVANNWYDKGGIIPGAWGSAVNIIAHGGEWVLNKAQQARAAAMAGLSREGLRSAMGFTGGPSSFAGGGQVNVADVEIQSTAKRLMAMLLLQAGTVNAGARHFQSQRTQIGAVEGISGDIKLNFVDLVRGLKTVEKRLSDINTHSSKGVKNLESRLASLQRQGGLFDKLAGSVTAMDKAMARGLNARAYVITKAGNVIQRMSTTQIHGEQLNNLVAHYDALVGERGALNTALSDNTKQLKEAEHAVKTAKGEKAKKNAQRAVADLRSFRTGIESRIQDVGDEIQQNMQDRLQAQIQVQQDIVDGINKAFSKRSDTFASAQRIATALGQTGIASTIADTQVELLKNQRDALQGRIQAARDAGATDLADQLESSVNDLNASIVEAIQQNIQAGIDQINNEATRKLGRLDLFNRMADALGNIGLGGAGVNIGGTTLTRAGVFEQRGQILQNQQDALQGQLNAQRALPADQQNLNIIQSLGDQIDELTVAIKENTKASFQSRIDEVNATADFNLTVNDLNKQLIEATAGAQGTTADPGQLATLLTQRAGFLADQLAALGKLFDEATTNNDQAAVQDLTKQMLQVQIAAQQNTQALNEVNGTLNQSQLSSTAWQQFRNAIFTSFGNLLPQYQIPAMGTPSMWGSSTIAAKPQVVQQTVNEGDTNVYVTEPMEVLDADYVAHTIAFNRGGQG